jgi:phosphoribosylamine--glycine ligase
MKVLVVGSGGREHAIAWRLSRDENVEVLAVPGNPGMREVGRCIDAPASDFAALAALARREAVDLTVVGPEAPLVAGIADVFADQGLPLFGPSSLAARLEGSKIFAKEFMLEQGIPTAAGALFDDVEAAIAHARARDGAAVVKADGLAAGKGVYVCDDPDDTVTAIERIMRDGAHGEAGRRIVIEDRLVGEEASVFCLTDGERYLLLPTSQDHKRLEDGDRGAMTGGMGAVSPAPIMTPALLATVEETILAPTLAGMRTIGAPYRGFLYLGLMITADGPQVLEYNCRLGDPEAQAVLPLLEGDFARALAACADGELEQAELAGGAGGAACVVIASPGYPAAAEKGLPIRGLPATDPAGDTVVFHAGTAERDGQLVTAGGRVLGVTARAASIRQALDRAYGMIESIELERMQYRKDIGHRALAHLAGDAREVEKV